jgi:DNA-binding NtrC family response regulator
MIEPDRRPRALIVDATPQSRADLLRALEGLGFACTGAGTAADAVVGLYRDRPRLALVDLEGAALHGGRFIRRLRQAVPDIRVIIVASPAAQALVDAGEIDLQCVIDRQPDHTELTRAIRAALAMPAEICPPCPSGPRDLERAAFFGEYERVFRQSPPMRALEALVHEAADGSTPVLVEGEAGLGTEEIARALHYLSPRGANPWAKLSCSSIPPELLELELFGRGREPGTPVREPGRLAEAGGGTLYLEEVGEMPGPVQARLLAVVQGADSQGSRAAAPADVRVIASTSRDLTTLTLAGLFHPELYRRLAAVRLLVPPLRERMEEVPALTEYFRRKFAAQFGRSSAPLSDRTLHLLMDYRWPGNLRELENMIKRYVVLGDESALRQEVESRRRALDMRPRARSGVEGQLIPTLGLRDIARRAAREAERAAIREVLERVSGNRAAAARLLRISYKTLLKKLDQQGMSADTT